MRRSGSESLGERVKWEAKEEGGVKIKRRGRGRQENVSGNENTKRP